MDSATTSHLFVISHDVLSISACICWLLISSHRWVRFLIQGVIRRAQLSEHKVIVTWYARSVLYELSFEASIIWSSFRKIHVKGSPVASYLFYSKKNSRLASKLPKLQWTERLVLHKRKTKKSVVAKKVAEFKLEDAHLALRVLAKS